MSAQTIFLVSGGCGLLGLIVTYFMVPDVTTESLHEMDRRWSIDRRGDTEEETPEPEKQETPANPEGTVSPV